MNIFLELMTRDDDFSLKNLKRLYRSLAKQSHPDLSSRESELFIRLKSDFEETELLLKNRRLETVARQTPAEARIELLKLLYRFSLKVFTKEADVILKKALRTAAIYDPRVAELLRSYYASLYAERELWMSKASVFYAHSVVIACIKQLFRYYNTGAQREHLLFKRYRQAMESWSWNIDPGYRELLVGLYEWLETELDGVAFEFYG